MPHEPEITGDNDDIIISNVIHQPCLLVLDTSSSMEGEPIRELNAGAQEFLENIRGDAGAREMMDIGAIAFGSGVREILPFGPVDNAQIPVLQASGPACMGEAVRLAIKRLRARREQYKYAGMHIFMPWLVLMTGGVPTDDWQGAAAELKSLGEQQKIAVFGVGIGSNCDFETLGKFCPHGRPPSRLSGLFQVVGGILKVSLCVYKQFI